MALAWTEDSKCPRVPYQNEADFETAILEVQVSKPRVRGLVIRCAALKGSPCCD